MSEQIKKGEYKFQYAKDSKERVHGGVEAQEWWEMDYKGGVRRLGAVL